MVTFHILSMFITVIVTAWLHIHLCIWTTYRANHEKGTVFTQHFFDNALSWQHSALITSSLYKDFYISYNLHSFPPRCVRLWIIKSARSVIGAGVLVEVSCFCGLRQVDMEDVSPQRGALQVTFDAYVTWHSLNTVIARCHQHQRRPLTERNAKKV